MEELKLKDIADDLLILNKMTIDRLFQLDNAADCIALYMFYYKTAKWQKTNTIKANDVYIKKSLKWGSDKIRKTKANLKENGLIDIVQRRKDGKIDGWYIEISYIVTERNLDDVKIKVKEQEATTPESNNTYNQQHLKPTSRIQDTNALKENNKCLKIKNNMLKNNNINNILSDSEEIPYKDIIDYLNLKAETNYKPTTRKTKDLIKARYNEGFTLEEFKKVIDNKTREWKYNADMCKYLRPETLFGTKFESYLNQKTKFEEESSMNDFVETGYYDWINEAINYDWFSDEQTN